MDKSDVPEAPLCRVCQDPLVYLEDIEDGAHFLCDGFGYGLYGEE